MDTGSRRSAAQEKVVYECEHCEKSFKKESTLAHHVCEPKRRWQDRNSLAVQLALEAYRRFYRHCQPSQKDKDWKHFASSSYYTAFVRFGRYMLEVKCVNTTAFIDYVIQKNVKLDQWAKDSVYEQFLISWSRTENPWDAIKRSLITAAEWAEQQESRTQDYFRYAASSKVLLDLDRGRISPWLVFCCDTGIEWVSNLTPDQLKIVNKWIEPDVWLGKINQNEHSKEIRSVLKEAGL